MSDVSARVLSDARIGGAAPRTTAPQGAAPRPPGYLDQNE